MIPVGSYPIVLHIIKHYARYGFKEFVLCLGHKGDVIKDFFLNYVSRTNDFTVTLGPQYAVEYHGREASHDWKITLAETGLNAMTGARIRKARKYLAGEEDFFLTYGDGLSDVDLGALLRFHKAHGRILTVTGVRPPGRFGEIASDPSGMVTEFNEKPQAHGGRISGGFFVCRKELFDYLEGGDDVVFETGPMTALVKAKQLMVYKHDGFWHPMDTHRDYILLNSLSEKGQLP
jgi:glucose-1-phosphate cytidylyltransferase